MSKEAYIGQIFKGEQGDKVFFNFKITTNLCEEKRDALNGFNFDPEKLGTKDKDWLKEFCDNGNMTDVFFLIDGNHIDEKSNDKSNFKTFSINSETYKDYLRVEFAYCNLMKVIEEIEAGKKYQVRKAEGQEVIVNDKGQEVAILNAEGKEVLFRNEAGTAYEFGKEVTFDEAIKYVKDQMSAREYQCDESILKSFYLGLQTDQLLLLTGRPGTGKSSFVRTFADVFGEENEENEENEKNEENIKMIAVQPNWMDRCELLGYYNALETRYISTPFLDALLKFTKEAKDNTDKLYFICLDEMNLSHIEYYFADFLSALQDERIIELYSKSFAEEYEDELKALGLEKGDLESTDKLQEKLKQLNINSPEETVFYRECFLRLRKMAKMLQSFPQSITIPENIKFIGTLNQDETTLDISPKVIDRSYCIRFGIAEQQNTEQKGTEKIRIKYQRIDKYKEIAEYKERTGNTDEKSDHEEELKKIKEEWMSRRVGKQTYGHEDYGKWCNRMLKTDVDDYIVAATILPHIRLFKKDENDEKFKKTWEIFIGFLDLEPEQSLYKGSYPVTRGVFKEMTGNEEKPEEINYWRK